MKEKGAGGYANFWKTPGAARGYADFNFKNVTGRKQPPEAMPFFEKPQMHPEAMQIFNSEKVI